MEEPQNTRFSISHCLGAWDWWSGRGHAKFEETFSKRRDGQCRTRKCNNEQWWQAAHCRCLPSADCGCGQLHCMTTENRADCDNARHRPATGTPTPIKSSANSEATQVEKLSARCRRTARKPIRNPRSVDNSILLCVNSPIGRMCGHLLQEGGREVGHSMLLMFVDSSSTITCKGS